MKKKKKKNIADLDQLLDEIKSGIPRATKIKKSKSQKDSDYNAITIAPLQTTTPYQDALQTMLSTRLHPSLENTSESMELSLLDKSGVFFGMLSSQTYPNYVGKDSAVDGHFLTLGGTGSGKTTSLLLNTLMSWHHTLVAIDLKGDMVDKWHLINNSKPKHLRKNLKLVNPSLPNACHLDIYFFLASNGEENLYQNARTLALSLLPPNSNTNDPIWRNSSQQILTGCILYFFKEGFSFIETMIAMQSQDVRSLLSLIRGSENELAKLAVAQLDNVEDKILMNLGLDLSELSIFATDPMITNTLTPEADGEVLSWGDINSPTANCDVIIQIEESKLEAWKPFTQLLFSQLLRSLSQRQDKYLSLVNQEPVLLLLDEFPRLGYIPEINHSLSTLRSRDVTIGLFLQSTAQLDNIYGEDVRKIIMDNCQYKVILSATDPDTQEQLSKLTGVIKVGSRSVTQNSSSQFNFSMSVAETYEPMFFPHEFSTLKDVLLLSPYGVSLLDKVFYQSDRLFPVRNVENHRLMLSIRRSYNEES